MLNPEIIEFCGTDCEEIINKIIDSIGTDAAARVRVSKLYGLQIVNGVRMPKAVTVPESYANYVADIISDFYSKWGGDAPEKKMEIYLDKFSRGEIPLLVNKAVDEQAGAFNAASIMGGD